MFALQDKPPDHQQIMALLAAESKVPVEDVEWLYQVEWTKLAVGAHITQFLHIFAMRNVQEILRQRSVQGLAIPQSDRQRRPSKRLLTLGETRSLRPARGSMA